MVMHTDRKRTFPVFNDNERGILESLNRPDLPHDGTFDTFLAQLALLPDKDAQEHIIRGLSLQAAVQFEHHLSETCYQLQAMGSEYLSLYAPLLTLAAAHLFHDFSRKSLRYEPNAAGPGHFRLTRASSTKSS